MYLIGRSPEVRKTVLSPSRFIEGAPRIDRTRAQNEFFSRGKEEEGPPKIFFVEDQNI